MEAQDFSSAEILISSRTHKGFTGLFMVKHYDSVFEKLPRHKCMHFLNLINAEPLGLSTNSTFKYTLQKCQ